MGRGGDRIIQQAWSRGINEKMGGAYVSSISLPVVGRTFCFDVFLGFMLENKFYPEKEQSLSSSWEGYAGHL